jgi:hypothetical protein
MFWHLLGAARCDSLRRAGQRRREARSNNPDLNFTASSCSAFFAYLHHSSAREDSESGVQANGEGAAGSTCNH